MIDALLGGGGSLPASAAIFLFAAAVVWRAGTRLAGYADRFAGATGLGGAVVGLVLLGGVTSLPEVATSGTAAWSGAADLAVNNLVGGVAFQLVVLAAVDMVIGRAALTSQAPRPDVMAYAAMNIVMLSLIVAATAAGDRAIPVIGVGVGSTLLLLAYGGCLLSARVIEQGVRWRPVAIDGEPPLEDEDETANGAGESPARLGLLIAGVGVVILAAGFLLTRSGEALAEQTGLGQSFFGAVFIGGATSLPEISSAVAAVKLKRPQLAIGDVLGGNLFNLSLLFLVDAVYRGGPVLAEAGAFTTVAAALGSLMAAIFLIGLVERRDRTVLRMGWDSALVLAIYVAGLAVLYAVSRAEGAAGG